MNDFLSIIIPTYNRKMHVDLTVRSMLFTLAPIDKWEIIVVDDGSIDGTDDYLSDITKRYSNIKVIKSKEKIISRNPGYARNIGIKQAQGNIIAFCDGDIIHFSDVISITLEHFKDVENKNIVLTSGKWWLIRNKTAFSVEPNMPIITGYFLEESNPTKNLKQTMPFAPWLVTHKDNVLNIGGFDERFKVYGHEDSDFHRRLFKYLNTKGGAKSIKDDNILSMHLYYRHKFTEEDRVAENVEKLQVERKKQDVLLASDHSIIRNIGQEWGKL